MKKTVKQLEELFTGLDYSFSAGFPARVMERIRNMEPSRSPGYYLSAGMSRLFYYINIPGLAAAVLILVFLLLSGDLGPVSFKFQYNTTITELLNNYYYSLIN
jgi:hypothetical protein